MRTRCGLEWKPRQGSENGRNARRHESIREAARPLSAFIRYKIQPSSVFSRFQRKRRLVDPITAGTQVVIVPRAEANVAAGVEESTLRMTVGAEVLRVNDMDLHGVDTRFTRLAGPPL